MDSIAEILAKEKEAAGAQVRERASVMMFSVYPAQRTVIEAAIARVVEMAELKGEKNARGRALEFLAADFLAGA